MNKSYIIMFLLSLCISVHAEIYETCNWTNTPLTSKLLNYTSQSLCNSSSQTYFHSICNTDEVENEHEPNAIIHKISHNH